MMSNTSLAEQILKRSDGIIQLEYLQKAFAEERQKRKKFYDWVTEDVKAEFINGEIVIHSPVMKRHWSASNLLSNLLSIFVSKKQLGRIGIERVMIALTRNDYEPDLVFFSKEKADQFKENQVLFPAPDFVVEILSNSTAKNDRTIKKEDYALHQIPEYWIIDTEKFRIEQYILPPKSTEYFPAKIHQSSGIIKSDVIDGFEIPVMAIFDEAINLKTLAELIK